MSAEIVGNFLFLDGYVYYHSRYYGNRRHWECRRVRSKECKARAVTNRPSQGAEIIIFKGIAQSPHAHPPNHNECKAEKVKVNLKRKAEDNPEQPPAQLLRNELSSLSPGVLCQLPSRENLSKAVMRGRRKNLPPNPTALDDFDDVPDRYQRTLTDEKFLIFDSGKCEHGRLLVFGTERNLQLLNRSRVWFLDGTFKVAPTIFTQVFTILGTRERRQNVEDQEVVPIPYVYALLSSKEEAQYTAVLKEVKLAAEKYGISNFGPQKIMTDFELAILNACEAIFPGVQKTCCFFHLKQSLYRKIQDEGLQVRYNDAEDETIRMQTHMLAALAFVPTDEVSVVLRNLEDEVDEDLIPIVRYFSETYVLGRTARGRRKAVAPRYPPTVWNQYDAALAGDHKTNNISEGWHNRFNIVVGKAHPDLYSLLKEFQKEQAHSESVIAELSVGKRVKAAPQQKWLDVHRRLRRVVESYEEHVEDDTLLQYLTNLAQNIYL